MRYHHSCLHCCVLESVSFTSPLRSVISGLLLNVHTEGLWLCGRVAVITKPTTEQKAFTPHRGERVCTLIKFSGGSSSPR